MTDAPFNWNPDRPLGALRVGYLQKEFESGPNNPNPSEAQRSAADARKVMYAQALDVFRKAGARLEPMAMPDFPTGSIGFVLSAEAAAFDDLTRNQEQLATLTAQSPGDWPNTFRSSRFIPAVEYIRAMRARRLLMQEMNNPALALKCGFIDNLPASIMVTGRLYDEATVCRVALAYEQDTEWHKRHLTLTVGA